MFSQTQKQIIDGIIISDGFVTPNGRLEITQRRDRKPILDNIVSALGLTDKQYIMYDRDRFDKRTRKVYFISELRIYSMPYFKSQRKLWYNGRKKIVPSLKLSPELVKYWFVFDGFVGLSGGVSPYIVLATDSFSTNEVLSLIDKFKDKGFNPVRTSQNKIKFKIDDVVAFYKYIGESFIECFEYKWISKEARKRKTLSNNQKINIYNEYKCGVPAKKLATKYEASLDAIYYTIRRFSKDDSIETIRREGVAAPSETTREAPSGEDIVRSS